MTGTKEQDANKSKKKKKKLNVLFLSFDCFVIRYKCSHTHTEWPYEHKAYCAEFNLCCCLLFTCQMCDHSDRSDPGRFFGDGAIFKAKLIGILEVGEARGDRMCQEALQVRAF